MLRDEEEVLVGLDIGTTEVRGVMAVKTPTGGVGYRAWAKAPHAGMRAGWPVQWEETHQAARQVVERILAEAGTPAHGLVLGVGGEPFRLQPRRGSHRLGRRGGVVRRGDLQSLYRRFQSRSLPLGYRRVGTIERALYLDGEKVSNAVGRSGQVLEIALLELWVEENLLQHYQSLAKEVGLPLASVLAHPLTTGMLLLSPEQREKGSLLVDFGGGHTHLAFFTEGAPLDALSLPWGSLHLSAQIARTLGIRFPDVERLKVRFGALRLTEEEGEQRIYQDGEMFLRRGQLMEVIESILQRQWLPLLREALRLRGGPETFPQGVVLAGQGSLLRGLREWLERALELPVQLAQLRSPRIGGSLQEPAMHTALGLATYALEYRCPAPVQGPGWGERLKRWWRGFR